MAKATIKAIGIDQINTILATIAPREGINLMRSTVYDIASQLAKSAKKNMADVTDSGDMALGTKAVRRRGTKTMVQTDVGVQDAFYWRFLEYGQGPDGIDHAMFLQALQEMRPDIDRVYGAAFAKKLAARLAKLRKKAG